MFDMEHRLGFTPSLPKGSSAEIPADARLVREYSDELYSRLAFQCEPDSNPLILGEFRVIGDLIVSSKKFELSRSETWEFLWGAPGQVLLEGEVPFEKIRGLRSFEWSIRYWSRELIYASAPGISARFTYTSPGVYHAELVVALGSIDTLFKLHASF